MPEFDDPSHWDTAAQHYEKIAHPFTALFAQAALAHVQLSPGSRVLDVAAGTGALSLLAARTGAQVLATDFSPGMVARIASRNLPAYSIDRADRRGPTLDPRHPEQIEPEIPVPFFIRPVPALDNQGILAGAAGDAPKAGAA